MRRLLLLCSVFLLFNAAIRANDTNSLSLVIDGVRYENVRWARSTPSTATFFHATGVATVRLANLPPEYQRQFAYDPQKDTAYQTHIETREAQARQLGEENRKKQELVARSFVRQAEVMQVNTDGLLVRPYYWQPAAESYKVYGANICITSYPKNRQFTEGEEIALKVYRDGTYSYAGTDGASHTVERWVCVDGN